MWDRKRETKLGFSYFCSREKRHHSNILHNRELLWFLYCWQIQTISWGFNRVCSSGRWFCGEGSWRKLSFMVECHDSNYQRIDKKWRNKQRQRRFTDKQRIYVTKNGANLRTCKHFHMRATNGAWRNDKLERRDVFLQHGQCPDGEKKILFRNCLSKNWFSKLQILSKIFEFISSRKRGNYGAGFVSKVNEVVGRKVQCETEQNRTNTFRNDIRNQVQTERFLQSNSWI